MKLFYNLLFVMLLGLFGLACDEGSPDNPEGVPNPAPQAEGDPEAVARDTAGAQAKYAPAQQFLVQFPCPADANEELAGLCKGEDDSKTEELFVVYQPTKDQSSEVVLVAQYEEGGGIVDTVGGSASTSQRWIKRVLGSSPGYKRRFCEADQSTKDRILNLSAAVSVIVGVQSTHLTGGISMRGGDASSDITNAQGYMVKSVNKDQSGQVTGLTLTKAGAEDVVANKVAGSDQASVLALGQYADFIQELKTPNFCETLNQPAQQPAAPTTPETPAQPAAPTTPATPTPPA